MLVSLTIPPINSWFILILESIEQISAIAKELEALLPWLSAEAAKLVAMFVFNNYYGVVKVFTLLVECD